MKTTQRGFTLVMFLVLIAILMVIAGGLILFGKSQLKETPKVVSNPTPIATPLSSPLSSVPISTDVLVDGGVMGFVARVPANLSVVPADASNPCMIISDQAGFRGFDPQSNSPLPTTYYSICYVATADKRMTPAPFPLSNGSEANSTIKKVDINGLSGYRGNLTSPIAADYIDQVQLAKPNQDGYFEIQKIAGTVEDFDKFLLTFKSTR